MDDSCVGQKGRTTRRSWVRGERPAGTCNQRFASADIYGAARAGTDEAFAPVLPFRVDRRHADVANGFGVARVSNARTALVLDRVGWHGASSPRVLPNVTLVPLPSYARELNPIERVWLYLPEQYLSHRILADHDAVMDACCRAWNALREEVGRIDSFTS